MRRSTFTFFHLSYFLRCKLILPEILSAVNGYTPKFLHNVPKLEKVGDFHDLNNKRVLEKPASSSPMTNYSTPCHQSYQTTNIH